MKKVINSTGVVNTVSDEKYKSLIKQEEFSEYIDKTAPKEEPVKRIRRSKEQIEADNRANK